MRKTHHIAVSLALLASLLPPVLSGCGKQGPDRDERLSIPVLLSVGELSGGLSTKMTDGIVQNDDPRTFRGIQTFYIVPFSIPKEAAGDALREFVRATDPCLQENIQLSGNLQRYDFEGADATKGFYSGGSFVPNTTNTVLAYGQATEEYSDTAPLGSIAFKRRHGVIRPSDPVVTRTGTVPASDLAFDLEPFLYNTQANFDAWKAAHLSMLNAIAAAAAGTAIFKEPATYENDVTLAAAFRAFSGEGKVFSSADVPALLTRLYRTCSTMPSNAKDAAKQVAVAVCAAIDGYTAGAAPLLVRTGGSAETSIISMVRPADVAFGLPEGAVALQWGEIRIGLPGSGFGFPEKAEGVNLAPTQSYCYPPALWYFVNSPLMGNPLGGMQDQFEDRTRYPQWRDIVDAKAGSTSYYTRGVDLDSKAALVRDPLQYAVGLLKLKLNGPSPSTATQLADKVGKMLPIYNTDFPLTGIVIGGQRTQKYDFSASDEDMRFVYDADVNDPSGAPRAWISTYDSDPVSTLVFQTRDGEDIYFALEFRNDSEESFTGIRDCTILPGSKFYLIGKMAYSAGTTTDAVRPSAVFVKDHVTTLTVSFESLAGACSVLPELATPDLQLGVSSRLSWDAVTPYSAQLQ